MKTKKLSKTNSEIFILGHCLIDGIYHYKVVGLQDNPEEKLIPAREVPSQSCIAAYWRAFSFERQVFSSAKIEDIIRENSDEKEPAKIPLWPEEEKIKILGILKSELPLKFAVILPKSSDISIVPSHFLKKKYPIQLSLFYEQNIKFQNEDNSIASNSNT